MPENSLEEHSSSKSWPRRRASRAQGEALETLGHAVEYLVDSRFYLPGEPGARDEQEAVQILMRLSRAVFQECPEVVSGRRRVARWFAAHFPGRIRQRA